MLVPSACVVHIVLLVVGDEDLRGGQFVRLGGVGEVAGDDGLGGVFLATGGVWDGVVCRPLIVGSFSCRVQFQLGVDRFRRRGLVLCFRLRGLEEGGGVGVHGGGPGWGVRVSWF